MNHALGQFTEQRQQLSREMTQKLSVLQTHTLDLQSLAEREAEQNPVLEVEPSQQIEAVAPPADEPANWERQIESLPDWNGPRKTGFQTDEQHRFMMESITKGITLTEHLEGQLAALELDNAMTRNVLLLSGNLNEFGWLSQSLGEISGAENVPVADLQAAQRQLLQFDPPGIGARDLQECLLVQLEREGLGETTAAKILRDHFNPLSRRRYEEIATKLDLPVNEVMDAIKQIQSLNPRPAANFENPATEPSFIVPELTIENQDGKWVVVVEKELTPTVKISSYYKNLMCDNGAPADVKDYIREQIKKGRFFISCLEQRRETIHKITEAIIRHQKDFFENGPDFLKPLKMAQIAEEVGMHESSVSRTVCGKFAVTPHGVFELRWFFTSGIESNQGNAISSRVLQLRLSELIKEENPASPLTDEQLATKLMGQGLTICRRTVVKYRERLGILPSALRRKLAS